MIVLRELAMGDIFETEITRKLRPGRVKELSQGTQKISGKLRADIKTPQYKGNVLSLIALPNLTLVSEHKEWSKCRQIQGARGKYPKIGRSNING